MPFAIIRIRVSANLDRYYYRAIVKDLPSEFLQFMEDESSYFSLWQSAIFGKHAECGISRKINKKFKPPKDGWVNNIYFVEQEKEK